MSFQSNRLVFRKSAWIPEHVNESDFIASCNEGAILRDFYTVNEGGLSALWENTNNVPEELDVSSVPIESLGVRSTFQVFFVCMIKYFKFKFNLILYQSW